MFTGIVETLQTVVRIQKLGDGCELTVGSPFASEVKIGDSVAVNGACLTVVGAAGGLSFQAGFVYIVSRGAYSRR